MSAKYSRSNSELSEPSYLKTFARSVGALAFAGITCSAFAMDQSLLYTLLVAEFQATQGQADVATKSIWEAAKHYPDEELYEHALTLSIQTHQDNQTLQISRDWMRRFPESTLARITAIRISLDLDHITETRNPLDELLTLTHSEERALLIRQLGSYYARVVHKQVAYNVLESALAPYLQSKDTQIQASVHIALAQVALSMASFELTWQHIDSASALDPSLTEPPLMALALLENSPALPNAENIVKTYLINQPQAAPEVFAGYLRYLTEHNRFEEGLPYATRYAQAYPQSPQAWLIAGALQTQLNLLPEGQASLHRYLALALKTTDAANDAAIGQAYITLSQIAERQGRLDEAKALLDKINGRAAALSVEIQRASIEAKEGHLQTALDLIANVPTSQNKERYAQLYAEIELLREYKQYDLAYTRLEQLAALAPNDPDILYDQAMVATELKRYDLMESLLQQAITLRPNFYQAFNALGYSLAERGIRLDEAQEWVEKANAIEPNQAFILDSVGWVAFKQGNLDKARQNLEHAYSLEADPEIAAHLGEVLWMLHDQDAAQKVWKAGMALDPKNELLLETLKRLGVVSL